MRTELQVPEFRSMSGSRAAALLAVALVSGCGGVQGPSTVSPASSYCVDSLSLTVRDGTNASRPVKVTLVQAQDPRAIDELGRIESRAWFGEGGDAFRRTYPEAVVHDWELVPGRTAGPFDVAVDALVAGVLFCETRAGSPPLPVCETRAGSPPLPVTRIGDVTVKVDDDGCTLDGLTEQQTQAVRRDVPDPFDWFDRLVGWIKVQWHSLQW